MKVTLEPDKNPDPHWLGVRREPVTYCTDCGESIEWCKCEDEEGEDNA